MISNRTVSYYCKEDLSLIENYDKAMADKDHIWDCHHRLEIGEGYTNTTEHLKMMNLYYDRPACELIFLLHSEHQKLHMNNISTEYRDKFKKSKFGNSCAKGHVVSKAQRNKHSKLLKGKTWKVINGRRVWLDAII